MTHIPTLLSIHPALIDEQTLMAVVNCLSEHLSFEIYDMVSGQTLLEMWHCQYYIWP